MTDELGKIPMANDSLSGGKEIIKKPEAALAGGNGGTSSGFSGGSGGGQNSNISDIDADLQARLENLRRE